MIVIVLLVRLWLVFFFKQKTAYEMRISDWSSYVCSSDLSRHRPPCPRSLFRHEPQRPICRQLARTDCTRYRARRAHDRRRTPGTSLREPDAGHEPARDDQRSALDGREGSAREEDSRAHLARCDQGRAALANQAIREKRDQHLEIGREWCREKWGQ